MEYGKLIAKVDALEKEVTAVSEDVKKLLELANQSKGGLWAGMSLAATGGGIVAWFTQHFMGK